MSPVVYNFCVSLRLCYSQLLLKEHQRQDPGFDRSVKYYPIWKLCYDLVSSEPKRPSSIVIEMERRLVSIFLSSSTIQAAVQ